MYGEEASKLAREAKRTIDHFPPYNDPLVRSITREIRHLHETCQSLIREYNLQREQAEEEARRRWQEQQDQNSQPAAASSSSSSSATTAHGSDRSDPNHTTLAMLEPITPLSSRKQYRSLEALTHELVQPMTELFWTKYMVHDTPLQRNKRILMAYHFQRLEKIKELAWAYNSLSDSSRRLLSPDEIVFFQEYERSCRNKYTNLPEFQELDLGLGLMISPPKEVFITVRVLKDCGDIVTESGSTLSLKKNSEHFVKRGDVERLINQGYLLHVA
ncbi:GINS complex subunit 1 [Entomortierella parvispora]|uniref:DNA replication complex GINS protein PSF1 n=1 Tax=Entomortierella parvispora TaxID=205924 RepID=A0A9P3HAS2_9FUNG|nr:GINS complex subunit 1 [Entomortierella parvispora]